MFQSNTREGFFLAVLSGGLPLPPVEIPMVLEPTVSFRGLEDLPRRGEGDRQAERKPATTGWRSRELSPDPRNPGFGRLEGFGRLSYCLPTWREYTPGTQQSGCLGSIGIWSQGFLSPLGGEMIWVPPQSFRLPTATGGPLLKDPALQDLGAQNIPELGQTAGCLVSGSTCQGATCSCSLFLSHSQWPFGFDPFPVAGGQARGCGCPGSHPGGRGQRVHGASAE